jgi:branched-chain amino acid transport system permease protein
MRLSRSEVWRKALKESLLAAVVALCLFGPMTGLKLSGYTVIPLWQNAVWLVFLVFVGRLFFSLLYHGADPQWRRRFFTRRQQHVVTGKESTLSWRILLPLFVLSLILPFLLTKYWLTVLILALIYVLLGLGLNIVVGLAGLLDLGFVAFYAVGAYVYALGAVYLDLSFWMALPLGALTAAAFGALLGFPVLRMHGDYLAIVTLGFGEIIRLVLNNWTAFTGGPNGVSVPSPTLFGLEFKRRAQEGGMTFHEFFGFDYSSSSRYIFIYLVLFVVVCLLVVFVNRLREMPVGRAWEALREDEIACRSLGINHVTTKLSAFSLGAMTGGIGGVFFAAYQGFINPSSFTFIESALILAIVVLGGLGSVTGVIIAALVLTLLPEVLREMAEYRMLIFGLLMVFMMIWRPRGLIRIKRPVFSGVHKG